MKSEAETLSSKFIHNPKPVARASGRMRTDSANALLFTMIMVGVALTILAGAMSWSATNTKQNDRANGYVRAVAAAEAASETVVSKLTADFLGGGEAQVFANSHTYRRLLPTVGGSPYWSSWEFSDANGGINRTYVQIDHSSDYVVLDSTYAGLRGFATTCTIVSNAREAAVMNNVMGGVYQQLQLARIPIFQFAMYTSGDMEISCGQPLNITGRVHSNGQLYVEPSSTLTFQSDVTAVGDILYQRHPLDSRPPPAGLVTYLGRKDSRVPALTLPIGTTNTPTAVREITQPPPAGENPNTPIGRQRYYNMADMLITVFSTTNIATSGRFNNFSTAITNTEVSLFLNTSNSFYDWREEKTILPIDLDIGALTAWSATNNSLRVALGNTNLWSVYVWDRRPATATTLGAVRVVNGRQLPPRGLTVATASPLYVLGHFNQPSDANLPTTNTTTAVPASLVGDAITILSTNWKDSDSLLDVAARVAKPTTVNAAILAGAVATFQDNYSGGMENFPRFLETWGAANAITYNGSMVKMFPSLYATNAWGKDNVYDPPARNWAYDISFDDSTKLPPLTPSLMKVVRSAWASVPPNQITPPVMSLY